MGHHFSIDVDELRMFAGHDWRELGEPCDHACDHHYTAVIGWGPDVLHYELVECNLCHCRAWQDGRFWIDRQRHGGGESAAFFRIREWRKVAA